MDLRSSNKPAVLDAIMKVVKSTDEKIVVEQQKQAEAASSKYSNFKPVQEALIGNQHKIDHNKNNKIDAHDFKLMRSKKKTAEVKEESISEGIDDHFDKWTNSEHAPYHRDAGDFNKIHKSALKYLKGTNVPADQHDKMAEKLTDKFHGIDESVEQIDELSLDTLKSAAEKNKQAAYDYHMDDNKHWARKSAARALNLQSRIKRKEKPTNEEKDTPGNGYTHQCALHVKHSKLGEGRTLFSQHAEPDAQGEIAWYDVMFSEGIHKQVPTSELEILVSESHGNHKRK